MTIYLVHAGEDGGSRLSSLGIAAGQDYASPPIAGPGWRTLLWDGAATVDDWHCAKGHGSLQIILAGALRISVTGGDPREVVGTAGDAFLFLDMEGDGHRTERVGDTPLTAVNIRLSADREGLARAFCGWPSCHMPARACDQPSG